MTAAWWTRTWNPIIGCSRLSPACDHCYAERMAHRLASNPATPQYRGLTAGGRWTGKTALVDGQLMRPLSWRRPQAVFVCSMGDLFHESVPDEWIDQVFAVMANSSWNHRFMLLTKRPDRMQAYLTSRNEEQCGQLFGMASYFNEHDNKVHKFWPLPHVLLGVTVEHPDYLWRIEHLLATPAAGRFVSVEPMLGPVALGPFLRPGGPGCQHIADDGSCCHVDALTPECFPGCGDCPMENGHHLDWVIAGGETGPGARSMHPDWVRSLRDQCEAAGVPFLFKQWGEFIYDSQNPRMTGVNPHCSCGIRVGSRRSGRLLDGVTHDGRPDMLRGVLP